MFFKDITTENIKVVVQDLDPTYIDDFLNVFCRFHLYKKITGEVPLQLLHKIPIAFRYVLKREKLVV